MEFFSSQIATQNAFTTDNDGILLTARSTIALTAATTTMSGSEVYVNGAGTLAVSSTAGTVSLIGSNTNIQALQATISAPAGGQTFTTTTSGIINVQALREMYLQSVSVTATGPISVTAIGPIRGSSSTTTLQQAVPLTFQAFQQIEMSSVPFLTATTGDLSILSTQTGYVNIQTPGFIAINSKTVNFNSGQSQFINSQTGGFTVSSTGAMTQTANEGSILYHSTSPTSECVFVQSSGVDCFNVQITGNGIAVTTIQHLVFIHQKNFGVFNKAPVPQQVIQKLGVNNCGVCPCPTALSTIGQMIQALLAYNMVR